MIHNLSEKELPLFGGILNDVTAKPGSPRIDQQGLRSPQASSLKVVKSVLMVDREEDIKK